MFNGLVEVRWKPGIFNKTLLTHRTTLKKCVEELLQDSLEEKSWPMNGKFIINIKEQEDSSSVISIIGMEEPEELRRYYVFYDDNKNEIYLQRGGLWNHGFDDDFSKSFICINYVNINQYIELIVKGYGLSNEIEW